MSAQLVKVQVFLRGHRRGGEQTANLDLDDSVSTAQLDELVHAAAAETRSPIADIYLRVLNQRGRVLIERFVSTERR